MNIPKYMARLVQRRKAAEAERYALARSPIVYAVDIIDKEKTARENEAIRLGLCIHGKVPRLIAERMRSKGLAIKGCQRCA